ncbi:hypothetical protein STENM327S_07948 [Streptomyces tendae]
MAESGYSGGHGTGQGLRDAGVLIARALEVVGERWTLLVIRDALYGVRRYNDFLVHLGIRAPSWPTASRRSPPRGSWRSGNTRSRRPGTSTSSPTAAPPCGPPCGHSASGGATGSAASRCAPTGTPTAAPNSALTVPAPPAGPSSPSPHRGAARPGARPRPRGPGQPGAPRPPSAAPADRDRAVSRTTPSCITGTNTRAGERSCRCRRRTGTAVPSPRCSAPSSCCWSSCPSRSSTSAASPPPSRSPRPPRPVAALAVCAVIAARCAPAVPPTRVRTAIRDRDLRTAFLPQRDPDAPGRRRPRAPGHALPATAA